MNRVNKILLVSIFLCSVFSKQLVYGQIGKGWEMLIEGGNLKKWQTITGNEVSAENWTIKDGILSLKPNETGKGSGRDIITKEKFENFELVLSFKLTKGANTGVKYLVNSLKDKKGRESMIGIEYQLIDDENYPAPIEHKTPDGLTGAVYLFYPASDKKTFAVHDWNTMKIVKKGNKVEHWLNEKKIVSYKIGSVDYLEKLSKNKFNQYPELANIKSGYISIQDHGNLAYFKDIKVKRLR